MSPKPAYERLRRLIRQRWWTQATVSTGPAGEARCRAFLGEHKVSVTTAAGAKADATLVVRKEGANQVTVKFP
jgi:hypothetical protein